jgi:hypothetical protein
LKAIWNACLLFSFVRNPAWNLVNIQLILLRKSERNQFGSQLFLLFSETDSAKRWPFYLRWIIKSRRRIIHPWICWLIAYYCCLFRFNNKKCNKRLMTGYGWWRRFLVS